MNRPIQEHFGEHIVQAITDFARADLRTPGEMELEEFAHVNDVGMRRCMSQVLYGARWLYKLGLATLARDEERAAHVRAQLVDYSSIVEAVLSDMIAHAIRNGHTKGSAHLWRDPLKRKQEIRWVAASPEVVLGKVSFWWLIYVAEEFGIVSGHLAGNLQRLREQRNDVHIRKMAALGPMAFLNQSKHAFGLVAQTLVATKKWRAKHA